MFRFAQHDTAIYWVSSSHEHVGRSAAATKGSGLLCQGLPYSFGVCDRAGDRLLCRDVLGFPTTLRDRARRLLAGENAFNRRRADGSA